MLRQACANSQTHQSLCCSHTQRMDVQRPQWILQHGRSNRLLRTCDKNQNHVLAQFAFIPHRDVWTCLGEIVPIASERTVAIPCIMWGKISIYWSEHNLSSALDFCAIMALVRLRRCIVEPSIVIRPKISHIA